MHPELPLRSVRVRLLNNSVFCGSAPRQYCDFSWKEATFRICSSHVEEIVAEIKLQRAILEEYIAVHPEFATSLAPVDLRADAPLVSRRMDQAARTVGVGPMAAVACTVSQMAAEAAVRMGAHEAIVDNGGDVYMVSDSEVIVGLYAEFHPVRDRLAVVVSPSELPLAICSSSGVSGRSYSLGRCDLSTVVAKDGALSDAAATYACNLVETASDIERALELTMRIPGILGLLVAHEDRVGVAGDFPELIRHDDRRIAQKVIGV